MGVWFAANGQVGGSEDGKEDPKEARREAAMMGTGSLGSQKSPLEVDKPAFPRNEIEKSQKSSLKAKMAARVPSYLWWLQSQKSPLEAKSLGSPGPTPSLAFAIWIADSGTTPGEKAFARQMNNPDE